jgi:hypothetical protein
MLAAGCGGGGIGIPRIHKHIDKTIEKETCLVEEREMAFPSQEACLPS